MPDTTWCRECGELVSAGEPMVLDHGKHIPGNWRTDKFWPIWVRCFGSEPHAAQWELCPCIGCSRPLYVFKDGLTGWYRSIYRPVACGAYCRNSAG